MKKKKPGKAQEEIKNIWTGMDPDIPSDVLGSYTGTPAADHSPGDRQERPIQDADDL